MDEDSLAPVKGGHLVPRGYQLEMVEQSLKQNIIVAHWDWEDSDIIWFCVPTVALAYQQHTFVAAQIPGCQTRVLSGNDNCEFWNKRTWDEVLKGTRIIISTYKKILLDALVHAFMTMDRLTLLIIDEAHKTMKNHDTNLIMRHFYHSLDDQKRPSILGMTASPTLGNRVDTLGELESNLNAVARTVKINRTELVSHTHKPSLIPLIYENGNCVPHETSILAKLEVLYTGYDIQLDPYIVKLQKDPLTHHSLELQKARMKRKTWCLDQLGGLHRTARTIFEGLGPLPADLYIRACIDRFRHQSGSPLALEPTTEDQEREFLCLILDSIELPSLYSVHQNCKNSIGLSPKLEQLILFLQREESPSFAGLIFVKTRAEVAVLSRVLHDHPAMKHFNISTFVGESNAPSRKKALSDLSDVKLQKTTLDDLRHGRKNLVVTTNALEEGIDVSACNVVVCFEKPPNLKSFIQRRGRARKELSKYIIMFEKANDEEILARWQSYEEMMKKLYEDDMRQVEMQKILEDEDAVGQRFQHFTVKDTDAKLYLSNAVEHLYHFCSKLSTSDPFVDRAPTFTYSRKREGFKEFVSADVILPCSIDPSVRKAHSQATWKTEKGARRDAAFQAYVALYHAGLVGNDLLPVEVSRDIQEAENLADKRPHLVEVSGYINIWWLIASQWENSDEVYEVLFDIQDDNTRLSQIVLYLPAKSPLTASELPDLTIYWSTNQIYTVSAKILKKKKCWPDLTLARDVTDLLLRSVFNSRLDDRSDYTTLFLPGVNMAEQTITDWLKRSRGAYPASKLTEIHDPLAIGLVRDLQNNSAPSILLQTSTVDHEEAHRRGFIQDEPRNEHSIQLFSCQRLSKRADFLHPMGNRKSTLADNVALRTLLGHHCEVDRLPLRNSISALLVPSVLHHVERMLVAEEMRNEILQGLKISSLKPYVDAITASSARELEDYQRLEFLGDCILKLTTSLSLAANNLRHHEGLLSHMKDHTVSNSYLARAALRVGLDRYIQTKPFTGRKWRPPYNSDAQKGTTQDSRQMSTKTLADVVESLLGAAYSDMGMKAVTQCLPIFFPEIPWKSPDEAVEVLWHHYDSIQRRGGSQVSRDDREKNLTVSLLEHKFNLLPLFEEAVTHPSYKSLNSICSYQRLEFIGDAILDYIVTPAAFYHSPPIPVRSLHLIRTALVNGDFLGYLCISHLVSEKFVETRTEDKNDIRTFESARPFRLWQLMRFSSPAVSTAMQDCLARFKTLELQLALHFRPTTRSSSGAPGEKSSQINKYPWSLLAELAPPKFLGDLIESLIAALWIDGRDGFRSCEKFLEIIGWRAYLMQVLSMQGEGLLHPKEEVGRLANQDKVRYDVFVSSNALRRQASTGETSTEQIQPSKNDAENVEDYNEEETEEAIKHGEKTLKCHLFIGDELVVEIQGGNNRMEIETKAAEKACEILKERIRIKQAQKENESELNGHHDAPTETQKESAEENEEAEESSDDLDTDNDNENNQGMEIDPHTIPHPSTQTPANIESPTTPPPKKKKRLRDESPASESHYEFNHSSALPNVQSAGGSTGGVDAEQMDIDVDVDA